MRWVTVATEQGPRACGVVRGSYVDVNAADPRWPATVRGLLELGEEDRRAAWESLGAGPLRYDPATARLLAPVPDPRKILCIGLNYRDHAIESGVAIPDEPVLFTKYPTALIGHGEPIVLPKVCSEVDYEAELVVAIGRGGRHIPRERAFEHVGGYMVGHDVSARDWQFRKPSRQWTIGKTFDTFAPAGPELVSPDEAGDPHDMGIRLRLNGQIMQDSSTKQLIFGIDVLIAFLSQVLTLEPGDLIYTGTPPGVGMARKPPTWLKPGDIVEVEIDRLGTLRNPVVGEVETNAN